MGQGPQEEEERSDGDEKVTSDPLRVASAAG